MKARRISTGEEVEVSESTYTQMGTGIAHRRDKKSGKMIPESDLDFTPAPEKTTRKWWVARDRDGDLALYTKKPMKGVDEYFGDYMHRLPEESLPSVTFENSPKRVRIEITLIDDEKRPD